MNDLAIIFIYKQKNKFTNIAYNRLLRFGSGRDVYAINQYDFGDYYYPFLDINHINDWSSREIWQWGSDNIFLYWYLSDIHNSKKYNNYLILEDDTIANDNILEFLGIDDNWLQQNDMSAVNVLFSNNTPATTYQWFDEQKQTPIVQNKYGHNNLVACMPLCCTLISQQSVEIIINHIKDNNSANKLHVETKFSSILKYHNKTAKISPYKNKELKQHIHFLPEFPNTILQKGHKKGVFHPVKDIYTYSKFFTETVDIQAASHIFTGRATDVTDQVQNLLKNQTKFIVNNSIFPDSLYGHNKNLYIEYTKNGEKHTIVLPENSIFDPSDL